MLKHSTTLRTATAAATVFLSNRCIQHNSPLKFTQIQMPMMIKHTIILSSLSSKCHYRQVKITIHLNRTKPIFFFLSIFYFVTSMYYLQQQQTNKMKTITTIPNSKCNLIRFILYIFADSVLFLFVQKNKIKILLLFVSIVLCI